MGTAALPNKFSGEAGDNGTGTPTLSFVLSFTEAGMEEVCDDCGGKEMSIGSFLASFFANFSFFLVGTFSVD